MKITHNFINPLAGFAVTLWLEEESGVMKMLVPGHSQSILFSPGEGVQIRIYGQGNQPVEVATVREPKPI
jgi:hypothetical protein